MVSFQVIYQISNLEEILKEINRVLKKDAKLLISVPFIWFDGDGNLQRRFSEQYSKFILEKFEFKIEKIINTNANMSAICLLTNKYIDYKISNIQVSIVRKTLRVFKILFITPFFNLVGLSFLKLQKKDNELYIDKIIYAKKIRNV